MLLNLEGCPFLFHLETHDDIEVHIFRGCFLVVLASNIIFGVVSILYVITGMLPVTIIDTGCYERFVHVIL